MDTYRRLRLLQEIGLTTRTPLLLSGKLPSAQIAATMHCPAKASSTLLLQLTHILACALTHSEVLQCGLVFCQSCWILISLRGLDSNDKQDGGALLFCLLLWADHPIALPTHSPPDPAASQSERTCVYVSVCVCVCVCVRACVRA